MRRWFVAVGLAVSVLLVVLVAPHASDAPDGLERVALDEGFADRGVERSSSVEPVLGLAVVFLLVLGAIAVVRAERKIGATLLAVLVIVATPREAWWAFPIYLAVLVGVAVAARIARRAITTRLRVELPFLAFTLFLPWTVFAKAGLALLASALLLATTSVTELLRGLERLHVPRLIVAIAGFMVRYLDVVTDEARRMHVARQSRAYRPRWLWHSKAVAASTGTLFVRAYERGERVHLAMLSRGYTGKMP